jgi:sugar O-acyltransferase (sialic acid O-acetyltransferase NeuD family)
MGASRLILLNKEGSMTDKNVVVLGASEHSKVVLDVIEREGKYGIAGLIDTHKPAGGVLAGYPILGAEEVMLAMFQRGEIAGAIIAIGDNWTRCRVAEKVKSSAPDFKFISAIHPSAQIAGRVSIGEGTVVMAGVVVNPDSVIGRHCIVNTKASLDHDCVMGDFSSLAPGVTTGGVVRIGAFSAISLGANIIHGKTIGAHTIVGAGALVLDDIPDHCVAYGVPAKVIRARLEGEKYL